jgi:hypothetical protein
MALAAELIESTPGCIRLPFTILIDKQEKAAFSFDGIRARSFIDKDMREYTPRTERRFLGIGMGDYSIDGYQDRLAIERKSMADFQGTLLGWQRETEAGEWTINVDRRARFKRELKTLSAIECKAVIVEANLSQCLEDAPQYGVRTSAENAKYLFSTYLSWLEEFPGVPWIFMPDRRMAEVAAFRIMEKFWARHAKERRQLQRLKQKQLAGMET